MVYEEKTITNLRGPAARIIEVSAETVPATAPASVEMTGPDQGRAFHFELPRGLPGVNGVENDEAVATYVGAPDSATATAIRAVAVQPMMKTTPGDAAPLTKINASDFGAVGDNVTDDGPAIRAALAAGGIGSVVKVAPGKVYRVVGELVTNVWQRIEGATSGFGSGATSPTEIRFEPSGAAIGIRARSYTHLKNLLLRGPGDAVGAHVGVRMYDTASNSISMEDVSCDDWATGIHLHQVYYGKLIRPATRRCKEGIKITASLNVTLINAQINGLRNDGTLGNGIVGTARPLNMVAGSIEQCRTFIAMTNSEVLNLDGVYFENLVGGFSDITGIASGGANNTTINATGCYIYMPYLFSWIDLRTSVGSNLNAEGNVFRAGPATEAPAGAVAYRFSVGQAVRLKGDNWTGMEKAGTLYFGVTGGSLPYPGCSVEMPVGTPTFGYVYDGIVRVAALSSQTIAAPGAAVISAAYERIELVLNAALSGVTFAATPTPQTGQRMSITMIQDATGGRTYAWPASCRFAGNAAPTDTTPNTRTTVEFMHDAFAGRWREIRRSVAVPN